MWIDQKTNQGQKNQALYVDIPKEWKGKDKKSVGGVNKIVLMEWCMQHMCGGGWNDRAGDLTGFVCNSEHNSYFTVFSHFDRFLVVFSTPRICLFFSWFYHNVRIFVLWFRDPLTSQYGDNGWDEEWDVSG